ncbi:MAG TPA: copper chaperone PCu(A)C [Blastococcus sp.]|nr:copper chaperone PCu(A)C [Blastococcus sp.]
MNRALGAATMGVLLLSPVALTACSAGQVTQTATQERDKTGAQGQAGDITLRQAQLTYPRGGVYESGDDAELQVAIVNGGTEDDTLVSVEGEGFGDVEIRTSTGATGASSRRSAGSSDEIEIPADSTIFIGGDEASLTLTDLDEGLATGQYMELTFTFENSGEVTVPVTVANPDESLERGEAFDFQEEEGSEESREGEQREGGENN